MYNFTFHQKRTKQVANFLKRHDLSYEMIKENDCLFTVIIKNDSNVNKKTLYQFSRIVESISLSIITQDSCFFVPKETLSHPTVVFVKKEEPLFVKSYLFTMMELEKAKIYHSLPYDKHSLYGEILINQRHLIQAKDALKEQSNITLLSK